MNRFSTRYLKNESYRAVAGRLLEPSSGKSVSTLFDIYVFPQAAGLTFKTLSEC